MIPYPEHKPVHRITGFIRRWMPRTRSRTFTDHRKSPQRIRNSSIRSSLETNPDHEWSNQKNLQRGKYRWKLCRCYYMVSYILTGKIMDPRIKGTEKTITSPSHTVQPWNPIRHHRYGLHERKSVCSRRQRIWSYRKPYGNWKKSYRWTLERQKSSGKNCFLDAYSSWYHGEQPYPRMSCSR